MKHSRCRLGPAWSWRSDSGRNTAIPCSECQHGRFWANVGKRCKSGKFRTLAGRHFRCTMTAVKIPSRCAATRARPKTQRVAPMHQTLNNKKHRGPKEPIPLYAGMEVTVHFPAGPVTWILERTYDSSSGHAVELRSTQHPDQIHRILSAELLKQIFNGRVIVNRPLNTPVKGSSSGPCLLRPVPSLKE